jgi:hypothetical protein
MVDLGQKKVDSYPPFFMTKNQIKKLARETGQAFFIRIY